ncbi:MAG TPA: hypothetical protein VGV92_08725 [Gammaproteobacteria bacterium]|nr:hypothetical protein [Gammaproteobacteria bacterium]
MAETTMQDDEVFSNPAATSDLYIYLMLILKHYASITIYIIEPYVAQNTEVLKIPAGENYSIHDYGGRLVITPDDIFEASFFACGGLLAATDQAIGMLLDAGVKEIAVLGDVRAKTFVWDTCERLAEFENIALKLINFHPSEGFTKMRSTIIRYLDDQGMKLNARLKKLKPTAKAG